ncbi:MAG: hypothetical protein ABL957_03645 [Parvularculaceae bacterium]
MLHAGVLGLAFVSLPESWRSKIVSEPVVPIEIISKAELAELTSVPAMQKTPPPKPEPPKEEPPAPTETVEPPKPEEAEPPPLPEPKPEVKPDPKPEVKPEVKPVLPEKPPVKPPRNDDLDFDRLSALVDKERVKDPESGAPSEAAVGDRNQEQVGPGDRLTASDVAKMQAAVGKCWQTQALIGAPEPEKLLVRLEFELNENGTLRSQPRVMNSVQIGLSGNQFWKVAEQVAVRAVIQCQPYDFLSAERYHVWREMELNFDPSQMAGF